MERSDLQKEILELQRRVDRDMGRHAPDAWINLNLTIAQLKSLFFIADEGSINLSRLAAALQVTPSNVTGIVDRLVNQGLVSRRENPNDRRMLLLRATDEGEELVANLREIRKGYMAEALDRMSLDDLFILARGLASLVKAAKADQEEVADGHD